MSGGQILCPQGNLRARIRAIKYPLGRNSEGISSDSVFRGVFRVERKEIVENRKENDVDEIDDGQNHVREQFAGLFEVRFEIDRHHADDDDAYHEDDGGVEEISRVFSPPRHGGDNRRHRGRCTAGSPQVPRRSPRPDTARKRSACP